MIEEEACATVNEIVWSIGFHVTRLIEFQFKEDRYMAEILIMSCMMSY
jgi:hypothetical protein